MRPDAKILQALYRRRKITYEGLERAVLDGVITQQEFELITKGGGPK
jgi:hypothetical protein